MEFKTIVDCDGKFVYDRFDEFQARTQGSIQGEGGGAGEGSRYTLII